MKKIIIATLLLIFIPISAEASECSQGGFYEYENGIRTEICFTEEDSLEHAKWYQSMVGIPVWRGAVDSNDKPIGLPEGEPYVLAKDLPPMPKPKGIRNNTISNSTVNTSPITTKPSIVTPPTINNSNKDLSFIDSAQNWKNNSVAEITKPITNGLDWNYLLTLSDLDLLKWFSNWLNTILLK